MLYHAHIANHVFLPDMTISLTPFHAFIGPNDSGKTAILHEIERSIIRTWVVHGGMSYDMSPVVWHRPRKGEVPMLNGGGRKPKAVILDMPETGLHPCSIGEVMKAWRTYPPAGVQVFIKTHSPLVINEMNPDEVSIVTRRWGGRHTKVTPISRVPDFRYMTRVYALGELWLSYANGIDESPLLTGRPRT